MNKEPEFDIFQKIGISVLFLMFGLTLYVWIVRYGGLPEPDWFEKVKGPSYPERRSHD